MRAEKIKMLYQELTRLEKGASSCLGVGHPSMSLFSYQGGGAIRS